LDTANVTCLKANSYENAHTNTGKMPALPAISCVVVPENRRMEVGMRQFLKRTATGGTPFGRRPFPEAPMFKPWSFRLPKPNIHIFLYLLLVTIYS